VFDYTVGTDSWDQVGESIEGEFEYAMVGYSVAMSADGTRLAIGGPDNELDEGNGDARGSLRVFDWDSTDWLQTGSTIEGATAGDELGTSVSISADGTQIAVGSPGATNRAGLVSVYRFDVIADWQQVGPDIAGEATTDETGYSVAMSSDGTTLAIGSPGPKGQGEHVQSGHVRAFALQTSVSFDAGDGENAPVDMSGDPGSDITLPTSEPTRTGHTFLGWNTASDGSGTSYAAGDTYTLPASDSDTLYAQWSANTTTTTTTTVPAEVTPPAAEPAEPVSDTPTFTG
jgi:uncharacterized repeat protein (TIGR02543 family)